MKQFKCYRCNRECDFGEVRKRDTCHVREEPNTYQINIDVFCQLPELDDTLEERWLCHKCCDEIVEKATDGLSKARPHLAILREKNIAEALTYFRKSG